MSFKPELTPLASSGLRIRKTAEKMTTQGGRGVLQSTVRAVLLKSGVIL